MESRGALGPLVFVFLQALQVILAPLPGEATGFAAGFIFGPFEGFILAMLGLALGSAGAFFLARAFRPPFERRLGGRPFYLRAKTFTRRHGPTAAFLLFLFPGFPKDYLCYALGLLPFPFRVFFPVMLLGRAPATLALTLEGDAAFRKDPEVFLWVLLFAGAATAAFWTLKPRLFPEEE